MRNRVTGTEATSRSSTLTPAALRPAIIARFSMRADRLESREVTTVVSFLRRRAVGHGHPRGELGGDVDVGQAGDADAAEQRPGPARLPHDRGVDDGARLDRLERVDLDARRRARRRSPTKHSSPSTTPSSMRTRLRRSQERPTIVPRAGARPRPGRRCRGHRRARGRRRRAPGRWCRARCRAPSRTPASIRQFSPITAGPTTWASGCTSAPSPMWTPSPSSKPGISTLHLARRGCPCGPGGRPRACRRPPSSPRRPRRRAARPSARSAGNTSQEKSTGRSGAM